MLSLSLRLSGSASVSRSLPLPVVVCGLSVCVSVCVRLFRSPGESGTDCVATCVQVEDKAATARYQCKNLLLLIKEKFPWQLFLMGSSWQGHRPRGSQTRSTLSFLPTGISHFFALRDRLCCDLCSG